VEKIVFMSSGGTVYGVPRSLPIDEDHPTFPISSYGIQKLTIEKYLHLAQRMHGLDYCILRGANVYGPQQRLDIAQGAVAVFLDRTLRAKPIEIWGDGSVVRDYLYVEDLAGALVKAATYQGEPRIFNVGSGIGTSLNELVSTLRAVTGAKLDVQYSGARAVDVPANVLECARARRHLGWQPQVSLAEGVRRTYEWLRAGA
jgi:UDP-glucose 4-epimerase